MTHDPEHAARVAVIEAAVSEYWFGLTLQPSIKVGSLDWVLDKAAIRSDPGEAMEFLRNRGKPHGVGKPVLSVFADQQWRTADHTLRKAWLRNAVNNRGIP